MVESFDGVVPDEACVAANSAAVSASAVSGISTKSLSLIIHAMPTAVTGSSSVDRVRGCESVAHCTMGASLATGGRPTIVGVVPTTVHSSINTSYPGSPTVTTSVAVPVAITSTCSNPTAKCYMV